MSDNSIKMSPTSPARPQQSDDHGAEAPQYSRPVMYLIGRSSTMLQGSGRHKNDDTGSRGFEVDQY